MISSPEWIKTVVSVIDSKMAWMMSPTSYLSAWLNFGRFGLVGGVLGAGTTQTRRVRRGLRAGRIVGRFNTTRLSLCVAGSFHCRTMNDALAESIETGVSTTDSNGGIGNIAYRGVELVGKFLSLQAHPRGYGGHGPPECVQLNKGYATVVSSDDSTRLKPT